MAFTRSQIEAMKEDGLRQLVIRPLLKKMGFHDVRHNHGSHELGKDFVMWQLGDIGARENWAVVAKAGPISGKTSGRNSAAEVVSQIRRALSTTFHDSETNARCQVNKCYVIASGTISEPARTAIEAELTSDQRNAVKYMDGDKLWENVQKHLPASAVIDSFVEGGRALDQLNPHWRIVSQIYGGNVGFTLEPKHPDAMRLDPFQLEGRFVFPDTPEGREANQHFLRHVETGSPVVIRRPFVEGFRFPQWLQEYLDPADEGPAEIHLGPRGGPRPATLRIVMETESGETFSHDRLRFTVLRQGTKEVALETDEPGLPWRLGLTINYESKELVLRYGSSYQGANVQSTFEGKKFELGLTKGGKLSLYDAAQGLFLLTGLVPSGLQLRVDEKVVEFTEKLSLIQRKTGLALHMPAKFEDGDWTLVSRAAEVVQNGYLGLRPPTITLRWGRDEIEHAIALFENQPDASFRILEDEVVELFGVRIPLGRVVRVVEGYQPDPASLEAVRAQLSQGDAVGPLELQLSGGEGATLHQLYERWLSAEDRARIPEDVFPSVPA